jgi:hypothetical protein
MLSEMLQLLNNFKLESHGKGMPQLEILLEISNGGKLA